MKILKTDCDPSLQDDKTLPVNAFLVEYLLDGMTKFDIVMASKKVEIFDHYWDHYRHDFINMTQTEGRVNPKMWNDPNKKSKKK